MRDRYASSYYSCFIISRSEPRSELALALLYPRRLLASASIALKRRTYARPSEGAEGANALGLKNAKPVPRDIFGFVKTGPRAIARGRGGD